MTDQSLRRADELLSELVELVETARTLPMSSSCVLPRERVLDLLDALRETMPPEMDQARRVLANRDSMLQDAHEQANQAREGATVEAQAVVAEATHRADQLTGDAEVRAHEIVEAGRAEHADLVSATGVHQAAAETAASLRAEAERYRSDAHAAAERYDADTRADAEKYAQATRADADRYAAKLTDDAEDYAERTLAELVSTLQRSGATAEQGRAALAQRRAAARPDEPGPPISE
jgi:F0F1-type ATP synthase membrane subunit b/b'